MKILEIHKNHVKIEYEEGKSEDFFLLDKDLGWYCLQTGIRFNNCETFAQCLYSISKGATKVYAETLFKPAQVNIKWPEYERHIPPRWWIPEYERHIPPRWWNTEYMSTIKLIMEPQNDTISMGK